MTWFFYALLCAFGEASKDILSKRQLGETKPLTLTWAFFVFTGVITAPLIALEPIPELGPRYPLWLILHASLYGTTIYLYMKAIHIADLSLCVPLTMLTPIFMLLTSPLFLGEYPNTLGIIGIVLIVIGSYTLNSNKDNKGFLAPFKAMASAPGPKIMLLVACIWSVTSVIDKLGIQNSSPIFWGITLNALIAVALTLIIYFSNPSELKLALRQWKSLLPIGIASSVQLIGYVMGMSLGYAVYVLAVKRCSVLMVIVASAILFNERGTRQRFWSSCIMIGGVLLIAFGS